jgi:hypothetical protein
MDSLSVNLERLATDNSRFGRWGDNYAYYIGDLSAIVLSGHEENVPTIRAFLKKTSKNANSEPIARHAPFRT